jgi:hypothetical protein
VSLNYICPFSDLSIFERRAVLDRVQFKAGHDGSTRQGHGRCKPRDLLRSCAHFRGGCSERGHNFGYHMSLTSQLLLMAMVAFCAPPRVVPS